MKIRIAAAGRLLSCLALIALAGFSANAQVGGRISRGTGTNWTYKSFVIPLDGVQGTTNAPSLAPFYSLYGYSALYHLDATNTHSQTYITNRFAITNAVAAFGAKYGGTTLYCGQSYHFGAYGGDPDLVLQARTNSFLITCVNRATGAYTNGVVIPTVPTPAVTNEWTSFITNGAAMTFVFQGLVTTFSLMADDAWGSSLPGELQLTHTAGATATNYEFTVWIKGVTDANTAMVEWGDNSGFWTPLYTLTFDSRPTTQASFVSQAQFAGKPMPSAYQGKSLTELLSVHATVTNAVASAATNWLDLDGSPELRDHPTLDQFVTDMGSNALVLAGYVFNQIALCDAVAYPNTNLLDPAVNLGGVNRGALGVFMEGQGSPVEQCALLVYLLRRAGVPAAYIYGPTDGVQMLDTSLSQLLRMQIKGAVNVTGVPYTTNTLISVNYPWVAAYVNGQWIHLFPWLKDTQVTEGLNLYDYLPLGYNSGYNWLRHYLTGDTNILSLSSETDVPSALFTKYVQNVLLTTAPGVSVDDLGYQAYDRQVQYSRWSDFPTPFMVTNGAVNTISNLTGLANLSPTYTNIWDTISVRVFSTSSTNKTIYTGDLRTVDLHNRKFLVRHQTNGANYDLYLTLAAFRPTLTNSQWFTNDAPLLNPQQVKTTLTTVDDQLTIQFIRKRQRTLPAGLATNDYWASYLGVGDTLTNTVVRSLRLGDVAAICLSSGKVSQKMVATWAQEYWNMQQEVKANPAITNSLSPDITQGTLPYLMGMAYYERLGRFGDQLQQLHKVRVGTIVANGLSKLSAQRNSSGSLVSPLTLYHPNVDMSYTTIDCFGNQTLRPDEGADSVKGTDDFYRLFITEVSSQEHKVVEDFYGKSGGISSVRLLWQAQTQGGAGMLALNVGTYAGYSTLSNYDNAMWQSVVNAFTNTAEGDPSFASVYITAKPITNSTVGYTGMGTLIYSPSSYAALISGNQRPQNGGWGLPLTDPIYNPPDYNYINLSFNLSLDSSWSVSYSAPTPAAPAFLSESISSWDTGVTYNNIWSGATGWNNNSTVQSQFNVASFSLGLPSGGTAGASTYQDIVNNGGDYISHTGPEFAQLASSVADPVNAVTGEFYIEADDLKLPGPIALLIRRNYSSQNVDLGDSQFGYGWRPAYQPYLRLVTNNVIYAAEMDGTVVAYRQPVAGTNFWQPMVADNPQLNNRSSAGIGSAGNLFNNYITNVVSGSTNYYLMGADGSVRRFQVMSFPVSGSAGNFDRTRPYLQQWTDVNGNNYTFNYQMDSTQPDYGQLRRIQSSNGNFLDFYFDVFAHIVQALTGDGRVLNYDYDDHGDLVTVTLPDESQINYTYQHTTGVTNGVTNIFSTHLIINETKPDSRQLANTYDSLRRVTVQAATVGSDLNLVTNATFIYSNNFTNLTNTVITGSTAIKDVFGRTNTYQYANNLITNIVDALGQTNSQVWFTNTNDPGYYPNSLKSLTDKRGLRTDYRYDSFGNLAQVVLTGNLTGGGSNNETATNTFTYMARNLVNTATDPLGNQMVYSYTNTACPMLPTAIVKNANGVPVSTNLYFYTSVVQVVTNGAVMTNSAFGLVQRVIRGGSATADQLFDGHGFLTQQIKYTGTSDPAVTNTFFYTARGELEQQTDAAGRNRRFAYDAIGRRTEEEVYEANATIPLAWKYSYYNDNGELVWTDGPRYNPEDYIWRDYDGAGRKITEIRWRSEGISDGSGVQAPADGNLYTTTFFQYDAFNNLTNVIDPLGNYVVRKYDSIGQLTNEVAYSVAGVAMTTNSFGYEPGGQVSRVVNPLGGTTTKQFTSTGKLMAQTNPDSSTNGWRYYLDGRVQKEFLPNGNYWETIYDDANLRETRYFHNASGILASNIVQLDARGNVLQTTDPEGNAFYSTFDGLDRVKTSAGPLIMTVSLNWDLTTYTTNIMQQVNTYLYDSSGKVLTVFNVLGETNVTTSDALGRPTQVAAYAPGAGTALRLATYSYGTNNSSVTVTNGTGANAVASTVFTDNDGHTVLAIGYPTNGIKEYVWRKFDQAGNRVSQQQASINGSQVTVWATNGWTYDGLNRVLTETNRDGAFKVYARDALGDVLSRSMPGGLTWSATYYNDGRIATEQETGGSLTARSTTYSYYAAGSPFAGRLQTVTDGRSTSKTYSYDDFLRQSSLTTSGSAGEQQTSTTYQYDRRNLLTNLVQSFNSTNTGPATAVSRKFDSYGQMVWESVSMASGSLSGISQTWDAAGRRTMLNFSSQNYGFKYQADGLMIAADGSTFGYGDNGLLTLRTNNYRTYTVTQRDGVGRVLQTQTKVSTSTNLTESLTWRNDGRLSGYTANRSGDFTDTRSYAYAPYSQRLTQESFSVSGGQRFTNIYTFDKGHAGGLGVLTSISTPAQSTNTWSAPASGGLDGLNRVANEQTAILRRPATGLALGAASVSATLDGNPANVQFDGTDAEGRWRAMLDMTPGSHTLRLAALHPSGQYTAYATNTFNTIGGADTVTNAFDGNENVTRRVWIGSNGQTNRTQTLTWDAFDRLIKVSERDAVGSGQDWVGIFDGRGRKVRTITTLVVSNTSITSPTDAVSTVDSWFDPQVEFQEVGVVVNGGVFNMKTYGPDANGVHGGLQGVGGLERVTPFGHISGIGLLQDYFGNIVGSVTNALYGVAWNPARFSSVGPVPGYQQSALTLNTSLAQAVGWWGKHMETFGAFYWGERPCVDARFLRHDSVFDPGNPGGFSMCGGDTLNHVDADARFGKQAFDPTPSAIQEWYNSTVLAPIRRLQEQMAYNDQFAGVQEARANFWKGALNLSTLGLYNSGSVAITGYDIYDQRTYGTERGIAVAEFSLAVASVVPWGRVAALGGDATEFLSTRVGRVGTFLDETAPMFNPANYRYDPARLYGGLPLPGYMPPAANMTPSLDALSQAASAADRGGLTAAGRSLTKHGAGARPGNTLFPAAQGNPGAINQAAQNVVDDILTTPGSTLQNSSRGRFGPTIEITAPDGRGMVYDANGKFLFFKE